MKTEVASDIRAIVDAPLTGGRSAARQDGAEVRRRPRVAVFFPNQSQALPELHAFTESDLHYLPIAPSPLLVEVLG